jgi:hypothetical protein
MSNLFIWIYSGGGGGGGMNFIKHFKVYKFGNLCTMDKNLSYKIPIQNGLK